MFTCGPALFDGSGSSGYVPGPYVGGTSESTDGTSPYSVSLTALTGGSGPVPLPGDLVIVFTGGAAGADASASITCSGNNSGAYNVAVAPFRGNDNWDGHIGVFYKIQGATPDTSLTVTKSATGYGSGTVVQVWSGIDATTPLDVTPTTAAGINSYTINPPAITPVTAGSIIVAGGGAAQPTSAGAQTVPANLERGISVVGVGSIANGAVLMGSANWVSGAFDPASSSGGAHTSASWAAATLALRPA